ncbi:shikimate 5-dehydrogenase [Neptunitalea chrysea]|uniref:Shikimate 5-dehydrogenase n=1 Tax=Neptunitalea chrysea TaxID=1647581 RepID=A0A9W6EVE0_9FLAO|nr:shikimate dehydrogenase [Neptunitalea chrysea]GLB53704.1 shikimate 5-dehydrogenase [Neptunitalea chrysea]
MENELEKKYKHLFGLLGQNIDYSFSRGYFNRKFENENRTDFFYTNFDIPEISQFPDILKTHKNITGFNVTIPYKESVIPYLDDLDATAKAIGAVNTIQVKDGKLIGYNTDYYGFLKAIQPLLTKNHTKALILGTGGASKAVAYVMSLLKIKYKFVSRSPKLKQFAYTDLNKEIIQHYKVIINTTPVGTFPNIEDKPSISYNHITNEHLLFDLIYNPEKTTFLQLGEKKGATIANGSQMLSGQAEKAWEIWGEANNF